jgi:hypothetical protein
MYTYLPPKDNSLDQFFTPQDIKRHPTFMRCDLKHETYNQPCFDRHQPFEVDLNNCGVKELIRPDGVTSGRESIKNIDIDSELKGSNRKQDKCYYNNYKIDPLGRDAQTMNSPLVCHKNVFKINETQFHKKSEENRYIHRDVIPQPCTNMQKFNLCKNTPVRAQQLELYDFNPTDKKYCAEYPCQRLFNNVTKRSLYPTPHQPQDLNRIISNTSFSNALPQNDESHGKIDTYFKIDPTAENYAPVGDIKLTPDNCEPSALEWNYQ